MKDNKKQPTLRELYKFRDRLRKEILGEKDIEYRTELEFVLGRTNDKIREVSVKQGKM